MELFGFVVATILCVIITVWSSLLWYLSGMFNGKFSIKWLIVVVLVNYFSWNFVLTQAPIKIVTVEVTK